MVRGLEAGVLLEKDQFLVGVSLLHKRIKCLLPFVLSLLLHLLPEVVLNRIDVPVDVLTNGCLSIIKLPLFLV